MSDDGVTILEGPPIPAILPAKGVGVFKEEGRIKFYVLSQFNNSDTTIRTPVTFKNAVKLLWNLSANKD